MCQLSVVVLVPRRRLLRVVDKLHQLSRHGVGTGHAVVEDLVLAEADEDGVDGGLETEKTTFNNINF